MRCRCIAASQPCVCPAPCDVLFPDSFLKSNPTSPFFLRLVLRTFASGIWCWTSRNAFSLSFLFAGFSFHRLPPCDHVLCKFRKSRGVCERTGATQEIYGYVLRHGRPSRMRNPELRTFAPENAWPPLRNNVVTMSSVHCRGQFPSKCALPPSINFHDHRLEPETLVLDHPIRVIWSRTEVLGSRRIRRKGPRKLLPCRAC